MQKTKIIALLLRGIKANQITPGGFIVLLTKCASSILVDQLFNEFLAANEAEGRALLTGLPGFERLSPTLMRFKSTHGWRYLSTKQTSH